MAGEGKRIILKGRKGEGRKGDESHFVVPIRTGVVLLGWIPGDDGRVPLLDC